MDAGYSVFSYDLRNHGESDVFDEGRTGLAVLEAKDVLGAVRYVKARFPDKAIFIHSQCYGTVATMHAMSQSPSDFEGIQAMVSVQPLSVPGFVTGVSRQFEIEGEDNVRIFGDRLKEKTGYSLEDIRVPSEAVKIPTMVVQVRADWRTTVEDIERIYAGIPIEDKKLLWIDGVDERLEGYNHFSKDPSEMLDWFDRHSK